MNRDDEAKNMVEDASEQLGELIEDLESMLDDHPTSILSFYVESAIRAKTALDGAVDE